MASLFINSQSISNANGSSVGFPGGSSLFINSNGIQSASGSVTFNNPGTVAINASGITSTGGGQAFPAPGNGITQSGSVSGYATVPSAPTNGIRAGSRTDYYIGWFPPSNDGVSPVIPLNARVKVTNNSGTNIYTWTLDPPQNFAGQYLIRFGPSYQVDGTGDVLTSGSNTFSVSVQNSIGYSPYSQEFLVTF
jgi:hypothetical protein